MKEDQFPPNGISARFEVHYSRFLDTKGVVVSKPLPDWASDANILLPVYENMLLTRAFDTAALTLQRTGRLGTYASPLGQEAIAAGVASAMQAADVLLPSYREFGAQLWRGVSITELLLFWGGDERGSDFQGPREDFPVSIPVASHCCHAVGVAYAFKLRRQARAVACFIGDGATSKGDFYEALNAAGAWKLPVLFVVTNNQWAISVPIHKQTAAQTLAQKAIAAGVDSEQVDGNDLLAVRFAADQALENARSGGGPYLIEALTYRRADHTTADDASRYRDTAEVEAQIVNDPIQRISAYLIQTGLWDPERDSQLQADCERRVSEAVTDYLATPVQSVESLFDFLYAELPTALAAQRASALDEPADD